MPERINRSERCAVFQDLGVLEYGRTLNLQLETRSGKRENPDLPDRVFFVQHPPVFTFGKRGGHENLIVSEAFLKEQNVKTFQTDRGGNITFHGPGQAVLYPIVDLEKARIGVADFVSGLEEIMKQTAADYGIRTNRDHRNHGLWVGPAKIGSVGLSIQKGISIHGLALNVTLDLTPFSWINPCGMAIPMTSIQKETAASAVDSPDIAMSEIRDKLWAYFRQQFHFQPVEEPAHV